MAEKCRAQSVLRRFMDRLREEPNGCIVWTGGRNHAGYGQIWSRSFGILAHRYAYLAAVGPIPPGMRVCHTCDNPPCCNHLFLGSQKDNMVDASVKGRFPKTKGRKLSWEDVVEIRRLVAADVPQVNVASKFGITVPYCWMLVHNRARMSA